MAHSETGIDIHPGAQIGHHFTIDSRMGKVFSANVFNDYFKWLENIPEKERGGHSATELWQHHRHESSSTLELAAGIFSLETNPRDYEEEAFARRMKKKKKTGRKRGI